MDETSPERACGRVELGGRGAAGAAAGRAPDLGDGGPDRPLDDYPGEAGEAQEEGDGQQDVGDQGEKDGAPVDLEARLILE